MTVFETEFGLTQRHLEAALGAGARHHRLVPALDVRVVGEVDLMALVPPSPPQDREIGDRYVIAAGELHIAEALVEDAVEPVRLLHIALEPIAAVGFVLHLQEMVDLAGHRPKPAHLPHQPFEHRHLAPHVALRPELAGLLAEINEDRAGFENADRRAARAVAVYDRRDPVVGADPEEIGLELLALADIDRLYRIGQPHFLERDADLAAVRRVPGPQFDAHRRVSSARERGGPQHYRDAAASQDAIAPAPTGGADARPGLTSA